jgi:hypothetical protein
LTHEEPDMTDATPSPAAATPEATRTRSGRRRAILAVILGILACLALVASTSLFWIHQTALNTDRWVSVTSSVAQDPEVIQSLSVALSEQVVTALDVRGRLTSVLPDKAGLLAGPITGTIESRIQVAMAKLMATEGFQKAWTNMNRVAHATVVKLLRGESDSVTLQNGYVTLNLFPLVGSALATLQSDGVLPANLPIPDLSDPSAPDQARAALQNALGVTLPDTFGTIPLIRADRLQAARTAVHVFDLLVVVALILTILLFIGATFLARDRRRAVLLLGGGVVLALLVARAVIRGVENGVVGAISDGPGQSTVRGVLDAALRDLFGVLFVVTVLGAIVALLAWLFGRREQVAEVVGSAGSAARRAGSAGVDAGKSMATGAAASSTAEAGAGARPTLLERARAHRAALRVAGIVVAAVWLAVIADGWEPVAIIGVLLVLYLVALGPLLDRGTEPPAD